MVWTEIRGVIKGQLDEDWHRCAPYPQEKIGRAASFLEKDGWLRRDDENKKSLLLNGTVRELRKRYRSNPPKYGSQELYQVLNYFESVDCDMPSMGEKAYLHLSDEASTVQLHENLRSVYWQIFQLYQQYLEAYRLFDGNDLVLRTLKQGNLQQYDLVVVDEVQDYTELQIYLAHCLCLDRSGILYVGDGNQNVNPTLFRTDHLRRLYRNSGHDLREIFLHKNYRSPDTVIRATNALADLRSRTIATQHQEQELDETAIRLGTAPYRLACNPENLRKTLKQLSAFPSTALLVPDNATKEKLISMAGPTDTPFIYTVSEIKGMEYKYVMCYNLVSRYHDIWKEMLSRERKSGRTGERYYFNLLYVAMTRSQRHLGFMDEQIIPGLEETLRLEQITDWDEDALHYADMQDTPAGWFLQARQSEEQGRYEDAIRFYSRANADSTYIRRCEAKQCLESKDYEGAFRLALLSGNENVIGEAATSVYLEQTTSPLRTLSLYFCDAEASEKERMVEQLPAAINQSFSDRTEKERDTIRQVLTLRVEEMISAKADAVTNWILERM